MIVLSRVELCLFDQIKQEIIQLADFFQKFYTVNFQFFDRNFQKKKSAAIFQIELYFYIFSLSYVKRATVTLQLATSIPFLCVLSMFSEQ